MAKGKLLKARSEVLRARNINFLMGQDVYFLKEGKEEPVASVLVTIKATKNHLRIMKII